MGSKTFPDLCYAILDKVWNVLVEKNKKYGDSALNPIRLFSRSDPVEQLKVRIDDKLKRIQNMGTDEQIDEDTVMDLIGYLVLLKMALQSDKEK